jgi:tetrathionate reductase subunit B
MKRESFLMLTQPRVFYIGLEEHLDGRVDGLSAADMMWRPAHTGAAT